MLKHALIITMSASLLAACGGGSSSSDSTGSDQDSPLDPTPRVMKTGQFIDSPVSGLYYQTDSLSGLTNANGEFSYYEGEYIEFSIGGIKLGSSLASSELTPFNLSGVQAFTAEAKIVSALNSENSNAYDRAINIAALLQSLDSDGDPEDGIDLEDAHELLAEVNFDLDIKATQFKSQLANSNILETLELTSDRTLLETIEHVYRNLGLSIESSLVESYSSISGRENTGTISYDYDENGNITVVENDTDNDGIPDSEKIFEYDSNGRLDRIEDQASNLVSLMYYNDENQLVGRSISSATQGNTISEVFSYEGDQLTQLEVSDEEKTQVSSYEYHSSGMLSNVRVDKDNDGENDQHTEYNYRNGRVASFKEDSDNDGQSDLSIEYIYDAQGNRTEHLVDTNQDGVNDQKNTFAYDSNNHLARYEQDKNMDGVADYIEDYLHNTEGLRTRYRKDQDADGQWDFIAHYNYDANGNRTKMIEDSNADGLADRVWERSYQAVAQVNDWESILSKVTQ